MIRRQKARGQAVWPAAAIVWALVVPAVEARSKRGDAQSDTSAMISRGTLALATRDFATAYREFAQAYRLSPSPDLLYQLGVVSSVEGKTIEAQDLLRRYLAEAEASEANAQKRGEAERVLALPHGQTGQVRVIGEPGSEVLVDDRLVGRLPLLRPLSMATGAHQLTLVQKSERKSAELSLRAGGTQEATFDAATGAIAVSELPTVLPLVRSGATTSLLPPTVLEPAIAAEKLAILDAEGAGIEPIAADCWEDRSCLLRLPEKSALDLILHADAVATSGGAHLKLAVFDVAGAAVIGSAEADCTPCTAETAQKTTGELLHKLLTPANLPSGKRPPGGHLVVHSDPKGADVELAGWQLGRTPLDRTALTGDYELLLKAPGYLPEKRRIKIAENDPTTVEVTLLPQPVATTPPPVEMHWQRQRRPIWRLALGGGVAASGAVVLGFGSWALSLNGGCVDPLTGPLLACSSIYSTTGVGAGLVAGGIAVALGGALIIALPGPRRLVPVERHVPATSNKPAARAPGP